MTFLAVESGKFFGTEVGSAYTYGRKILNVKHLQPFKGIWCRCLKRLRCSQTKALTRISKAEGVLFIKQANAYGFPVTLPLRQVPGIIEGEPSFGPFLRRTRSQMVS